MNPNSALLWLPAIQAARLPTPRTAVVPYVHHECLSIFDGEASAEFSRLSAAVESAALMIGYPVFVRTDLASAKHSGPRAYRLDAPGQNQAIAETIEDNELKFWLEPPGPQAFLVREFLNLEHKFVAFQGLPVAREWRFFADSDHIICWHPYWPKESLVGHVDEGRYPDWTAALEELHAPTGEEEHIGLMAVHAAKACGGGTWSVDFCRDVNGKIWLTDMAAADQSYHWPGCVNGVNR